MRAPINNRESGFVYDSGVVFRQRACKDVTLSSDQ